MGAQSVDYKVRPGSPIREGDLPEIRKELEAIRERRQILTAPIVLEEARDPGSPLHKYFTWNVGQAAEERWLDQARSLIRVAQVVIRHDTGQTTVNTAYVSIKKDTGRQYVPVLEALSEAEMAQKVEEEFWDDLQAFIKRYESIESISGVLAEIQAILNRHRPKKGGKKQKK